jgi:glycerol-3-phosphate dehydrogenase
MVRDRRAGAKHRNGKMKRTIPGDLEQRRFDLIVIGAGINGVAIARDAAMRGLSVLVLEKDDIASGTTSWSTRLIHGGLRYLEHAELGLVRESLRERERLLHNAPHLVKPLGLLLPIYEGAKRGPILIRAGMTLYDVLSFDKSLDHHHMLKRNAAIGAVPTINDRGLRGAALYYDAQVVYAERLAVENALSAAEHGAVIVTHAQVDRIDVDGAVVRGVEFFDKIGGSKIRATSRAVINVAGPWVDRVLADRPNGVVEKRMIGGTKGSHLILDRLNVLHDKALYFEANDGRPIFVVPWNGFHLIGTTDLRFEGNPDDVRINEAEIDYLIHETAALLPGSGISRERIRYSYSGVRPLPYHPDGAPGSVTRRHVIVDHAPRLRGLFSVIGGKLTTHRSLAEAAVNEIQDQIGRKTASLTADAPLPGGAGIAVESFKRALIAKAGPLGPSVDHLMKVYGSNAAAILDLAQSNPDLGQVFDEPSVALAAEVVYAVEHEGAVILEDILMRRTMVGLGPNLGIGADETAARIAVAHLGWTETQATSEVAAYRRHIERFQI